MKTAGSIASAILAVLAIAQTATAAPRHPARVGTPVSPAVVTGADADGRVTARVTPRSAGRRYELTLFERQGIPVYPPGTIADCFAYGREGSMRTTPLDHFAMTCRPRENGAFGSSLAHYDAGAPLSPERYRRLRKAGRPLPGETLVVGRAGAAIDRVEVRAQGRRWVLRPRAAGGGILMGFRGWLEATTVQLRLPDGRTETHRFGKAGLRRNPDGSEVVIAPELTTTYAPPPA